MSKIEIVSMIRIDGKWYKQEEVPEDELKKLLETKITEAMQNIGFIKKEPSTSVFGNLAAEEK